MPNELVGSWSGGSTGATANTLYTFRPGGKMTLTRNGIPMDGTVVVDGATLTLYLPGGPVHSSWRIERFDAGSGYTFSNLLLDGFSYIRQDTG